jgi:hypothetical protein
MIHTHTHSTGENPALDDGRGPTGSDTAPGVAMHCGGEGHAGPHPGRSLPARVCPPRAWLSFVTAAALLLGAGLTANAQVTPAAGYTPPDDTPSIKVGALIFADYTYQQKPTSKDAAGNDINPSSFNVSRAYINVTGNISHIVAFRVTPDVTRVSIPGASLDGSVTYRLKYAYAQINLDDWLPKGSWVKIGMQQTPFIDSVEGIYRYRFQGTVFPEREGYMASADIGVTFRTTFPNNYGDIHFGFYNGEGYSKPEVNNEKAFMARVGFKPLPRHQVLKNWRLQVFQTWDAYMKDAPRNRTVLNTTFEHPYINFGIDYLATTDKVSSAKTNGTDLFPTLEGKGWSFWATPKKIFPNNASIEALVRYDHMKPGGTASVTAVTSPDGLSERWIGGVAYWFPKQGSVTAALLFDVETMAFSSWTPSKPTQQRIYLHSLISF